MLKALLWLPFTLIFVAMDYWKWAVGGNIVVAIAAPLWCLTAGVVKWLEISLMVSGGALALTFALWLVVAAVEAWRSRNTRFRLGITGG